jgi:hypothetical protein
MRGTLKSRFEQSLGPWLVRDTAAAQNCLSSCLQVGRRSSSTSAWLAVVCRIPPLLKHGCEAVADAAFAWPFGIPTDF